MGKNLFISLTKVFFIMLERLYKKINFEWLDYFLFLSYP